MCGTKLPGTAKADGRALTEQHKQLDAAAPKLSGKAKPDQRLGKLSMYLGIFGPAIIVGWLAIRRRQAGREKAMIGIGLGSLSTAVLLVLLITLAASSSKQPKEQPPNPDEVLDVEMADFELSVERQLVEFRELAEELAAYFEEDRLPEDVDSCLGLVEYLQSQLDTLKALDDEADVTALRHRMRSNIRDLKRILRDYTYN
jgi:NH3-dependent NAD+ synthetase